jgi:Elongation complex protein 6
MCISRSNVHVNFTCSFLFLYFPDDETSSKSCTLKNLYNVIQESVIKLPGWPDVPTLLLVDDLSILTSIGYSSFEVTMFAHYLQALVCDGRANKTGCMASLVHAGIGSVDDTTPLHCIVGHRSDVIVSIQPLKTGYCRDLSGEVGTMNFFVFESEIVSVLVECAI